MKARLAMVAVVLLAMGMLTACDPEPNPRVINGVVIQDRPPYMNDTNLAILRYWYVYTHNPTVVGVDQAAAVETASTDSLLDVYSAGYLVPDNVLMARAAWFSGEFWCLFGVTVTGVGVIAAVADPPATLGGVIVAWALGTAGVAQDLNSCWDTFMWAVKPDAQYRWMNDCRDAYLTGNDYNMLDPGWQQSAVFKFQQCVVFGWAKDMAIQNGAHFSGDLAWINGNYVCTQEIFVRCYWT